MLNELEDNLSSIMFKSYDILIPFIYNNILSKEFFYSISEKPCCLETQDLF